MATNDSINDYTIDVLDLSVPKAHSTTIGNLSSVSPAGNLSSVFPAGDSSLSPDSGNLNDMETFGRLTVTDATNSTLALIGNDVQPRFSVVASTSTLAIREITLPPKGKSIGRPKGSKNNVIGTKKKTRSTMKIAEVI